MSLIYPGTIGKISPIVPRQRSRRGHFNFVNLFLKQTNVVFEYFKTDVIYPGFGFLRGFDVPDIRFEPEVCGHNRRNDTGRADDGNHQVPDGYTF